ncbi:hypothetical protein TRFO_19900 [Tritrichomonas foetus]|uniref:Uncharacterized protein n=1 Tax=Tritrichomonas foetus TaxID=1144522 RepID=A0A1J4KI95_9EUKA|nr:hypothetical protein TRFO_19900 [Tritrichomonas foetus]|eukprot:OHT10762.1 hypothetical protein TRFO_19900 [Tritrichomonas foetus]
MYGHLCEEPIALVCPHPWNYQIILCTTKQNLVLLDVYKNRSIRTFSIPSSLPKDALSAVSKSSPIGLFFIDNIACRAYQSILRSTIQQLPADKFICLVFPRGLLIWNHTIYNCEWIAFDFVATCVAQTPDSLILGDNANSLFSFSLHNYQVKRFANTQGTPSSIFITLFAGDQYGVLSVSSTGAIDFFSASGKLAAQGAGESSKSITFDVYTNTLFIMSDKRTVHVFNITPTKIEKIGECSFSGVTAGESKPTNYSGQQIAPCRLPLSPKPLFYAICDSLSLLIGGSTKVVQKVSSFPAVKVIKKLNCSLMLSHPTDMSLLMMASENQIIVLDMWAHLPHVVPSLAIPDFIPQNDRLDGVYSVRKNDQIVCLMNHSTESYSLYDIASKQRIVTRNAIDVIVGPDRRYAELKLRTSRKGKDSAKTLHMTIEVFDDTNSVKSIPVVPPKELEHPMRLISFGDFFAVIVGKNPLDLSFNMQQQGKTAALVYRWSTQDPIALQFDGSAMIAYEPPYIALASPNGYAVFDTEHEMKLIVRREKRVFHFTFFEGKLYLLTIDGLEIDNFKTVELVSSRFSHLITKEKNAPPIPMNTVMIKEVLPGTVTLLDIRGNSTTVGIPEEHLDDENAPLIVKVANADNHLKAASEAYRVASPQELKSLMLMMMNDVGWDKVLEVLSESEKAASEIAAQDSSTEFQQEFHAFLMKELEVDQ